MKNDELRALVLVPIILAAALTAYQGFSPKTPAEVFSELAILGPNMKAADYPKELLMGQEFDLYLYVGNHEGRAAYYMILVKLGNGLDFINETVPMNAPVLKEYDRVLASGETWINPVTLSVNQTGVNLRLVFEMWIYNEQLNDFRYYGRWNQLWLNVTAPS